MPLPSLVYEIVIWLLDPYINRDVPCRLFPAIVLLPIESEDESNKAYRISTLTAIKLVGIFSILLVQEFSEVALSGV